MLGKNKQFILFLCMSLFIINIISSSLSITAKNSVDKNISLNSQQLKQGNVLVIRVKKHQIHKIIFNQREYKINKDRGTGNLISFIPLSYWLKPGNYQLKIIGDNYNLNKSIEVLAGNFEESFISVDSNKEELVRPQKKETIERKKRDNQLIHQARKFSNSEKLWQNKFIWPVKNTISTSYGASRYVNNELQSRHSGIDIAASRGNDVKATASGIVKLSAELLVTGNTIIIDHGWDVFSSYSHLDTMNVSAGQEVNKGDIIASIGSTGFSTGPHLHWTVTVNGVFINPEQFIDEDLCPSN